MYLLRLVMMAFVNDRMFNSVWTSASIRVERSVISTVLKHLWCLHSCKLPYCAVYTDRRLCNRKYARGNRSRNSLTLCTSNFPFSRVSKIFFKNPLTRTTIKWESRWRFTRSIFKEDKSTSNLNIVQIKPEHFSTQSETVFIFIAIFILIF